MHLIPVDKQDNTRKKFIGILSSYTNQQKHIKRDVLLMNNSLQSVDKFLKENNILATRADKGNITVLLNKDSYIEKTELMLNDHLTYLKINKNPGNKLKNMVNTVLKRWKANDYINKSTFYYLNPTSNILPCAYALPKVHKTNVPFRLIVSSIGSPFHKISRFVHNILYNNLPKGPSFIKNSIDLINKLQDLLIPNNYKLISFDVVSLFTNIPKVLVLKGLKSRWDIIKNHTKISEDEFLKTVELILDSTYFTFNSVIYKQLFGSPMGSPLSPTLADIVLQDLESHALSELERINCRPLFYYRYVDDILLCLPEDKIDLAFDIFNEYDEHLQFTREMEINSEINFLDVTIINENGVIINNWYVKPTFSERFLNFNSNHPLSQRKSVAIGLIDRVCKLSDSKFLEENLKKVETILLKNQYPIGLVHSLIYDRLLLYSNTSTDSFNNKNSIDTSRMCVFPYVKNLSETIGSIIKKFDIGVVFKPINKLDKLIKTGKDRTEKMEAQNIVYKIDCKGCNSTYIGQTKRSLKTRINEHKNNIKSPNLNVISDHRLDTDHNFDWDNVEILDREPNYNKRLVSEMLHISAYSDSLNIKSDTSKLHQSYDTLINNTKKLGK